MCGDSRAKITRATSTMSGLNSPPPLERGSGKIFITTVNGVDKNLSEVSQELDNLSGDFTKYLVPTGGTYNCRNNCGFKRKIDARVWRCYRLECETG